MRLKRINSRSVRRLQRGTALYLLTKARRLRGVARTRGSPEYAEHIDSICTLLKTRLKRTGIS